MNRLLASFVVVAALVAPAAAETIKIPDAALEVWYPERWNVERANGTVTITAPGDDVALSFVTVPGEKLDDALAALDAQLGRLATDIQSGKPSETTINGMKAVVVDGKGKVKGRRVDLSVALVLRPGKKVMMMLGFVESSKLKSYERELTKIVTSMRPL
jgi:hypothetical protein